MIEKSMLHTKPAISNDFGHTGLIASEDVFSSGKPVVSSRKSISVFQLKKEGVFGKLRAEAQQGFQSGGYNLKLIKDHIEGDCYIKWTNYGPRNQCNTIDLVPTKCHYGGQRQWFRCPACFKRVGILYEYEDDFKCRTCLGLCYPSQKMNYRTIEPAWTAMIKLKKTVPVIRTYKGILTQRGMRYEKLRAKAEMGLVLFGSKYTNR